MRTNALVVVLLVAGCGSQPALDYGRELFDSTSISSAASNPFKCSTCHEVTAAPTKQLPGYVLYDSAVRASWWGGNVQTLLDATNQCIYNFMASGKDLTATDDKGRALFVYLQSISPDASAPTLPLTVVENIVDVPSGDAGMGQAIWNQSCANCHGAAHTGQGRLSDQVSIVPDDSIAAHGTSATTGARPVVIEKVRHGKFFAVGGNMPLFSLEAMSDASLGDILAYLETFGLPPSQ
ncbi:MAG TPA: c-type cytochrome [Polyangia bacterium]